MAALSRLARCRTPGGSPVRWVVLVLTCAVLGALTGPALGDAEEPDREDGPTGDESTEEEGSSEGLGLPSGGDTDEGSRLYSQQCARCHGPAGQGGDLAPSLHDLDVGRVDLVLRTNRMPPANQDGEGRGQVDWSDEQRADILAYAAEEFDLTGSLPRARSGEPSVGRELYAGNCAACHGQTGDGGVAGAGSLTPKIAGQDPVTIAEAIRIGPFQMPQFGERQVSDEGLGHIAAYLESVSEEEGTPLFGLVELNPVYASAFVALLALVAIASCVWLGGRVLMFPDPVPEPGAEADQDTDGQQEGEQP